MTYFWGSLCRKNSYNLYSLLQSDWRLIGHNVAGSPTDDGAIESHVVADPMSPHLGFIDIPELNETPNYDLIPGRWYVASLGNSAFGGGSGFSAALLISPS